MTRGVPLTRAMLTPPADQPETPARAPNRPAHKLDFPGGHSSMRGLRFFLLCAVILVWAAEAQAQPQLGNQLPNPRLNTVYPPGGKIGTTFDVTFTGTDLDLPQALLFSHPG